MVICPNPNCKMENPDGVSECCYCGLSFIAASQQPPPPYQPPTPAAYQPPPPVPRHPPRVIVQQSAGGPFSCFVGALNFVLAALVVGLIVGVVLVMLCVVRLPSKFPVIDLPGQLDELWSRAVSLQRQVCPDDSGPAPPVVQPPVVQPPVDKKKPKKETDKIKPVETEPPIKDTDPPIEETEPPIPAPPCSSGLSEWDCQQAGGNSTMICPIDEGCYTTCLCN